MDDQTLFAAISSVTLLAYMLVVLNRHLAERRAQKRLRQNETPPPTNPPRDPGRPWG